MCSLSGGASAKEPASQYKRCKRRVQSLGWEDPLEEGMAARCSILAWRIPWTEEPGGFTVYRAAESDMTEAAKHTCMHTMYDVLLVDIKYIYT